MKVLRSFFSDLHRYLLWLLISVIFWGWIFSMITDARPEHKLVLCVDRPELQDHELTLALEKERPDGVRLIKVHPIDYYVFSQDELEHADLYIIKASRAEELSWLFLPLADAGMPTEGATLWSLDGTALGLRVYCAETGEGALQSYIEYAAPGETGEDYYLFFGANSAHLSDGAARRLAERLLRLP